MIYCFIGHRGTGKTFLLDSLKHYAASKSIQANFYDLDAYIESSSGKTISHIFETQNEATFRELETSSFDDLYNSLNKAELHFISIGAGFKFDLKKYETYNYWLFRESDRKPRYFSDRPRLMPEINPEQEFKILFSKRNKKYDLMANEFLSIPPIMSWPFDLLAYFFHQADLSGTSFCIHQRHLQNFEHFVEKLNLMNIDYFEFRNDLLSEHDIITYSGLVPKNKRIISFRRKSQTLLDFCKTKFVAFDWALELGAPPKETKILSLHDVSERDLEIQLDNFNRYEKEVTYLKLAPVVKKFSTLKTLHNWSYQSSKRSFLPRSQDNKWKWYRHFVAKKNFINFLSCNPIGVKDQNSSLEHLFYKKFDRQFAAVLGSPIQHSLSPSMHRNFFEKPFYPIDLAEEEFKEAFEVLKSLGLNYAAVTSPLKKKAFQICDEFLIENIDSCNTLTVQSNKVIGTNTDLIGFSTFKKYIDPSDQIVIWGGGGTLLALLKTFPEASSYSLRQQKARKGFSTASANVVIWAVSNEAFAQFPNYPPTQWPVHTVIDLNYTSNSPGKNYALACGAQYISGMEMFMSQAKEQQKIWMKYGN